MTELEPTLRNTERLIELAFWEAYRRHRKASDDDGFGVSNGHAGQFQECAHEDCKLVRSKQDQTPIDKGEPTNV